MTKCILCKKELSSGDTDLVCEQCTSKIHPKYLHQYYQQGWICPKCGSVYGPSVTECSRCNPPQGITVTFKGDGQ